MWGLQLNVVCLFQEQLQLKNVEKQLLHLQREARRQSKDQELCGLTPRSQLVCLAVYILSGFRLDVAEAFVRDSRKCRKRALPEEALSTDIPTKIREWFRDCPLECLYHLQQPPASSEKNKAVHEEAAKYVAKWDTAAWVTQQNYICGVAPTYDALVHKYFQELDKRDLAHLSERLRVSAECGDGKAAVPGRTARAWCGRFCKQFAITRKRLGMSTEMPMAEVEEKVAEGQGRIWFALSKFESVRFVTLVHLFWDDFFGPQNLSCKGCGKRFLIWFSNHWVPFWVPFWVPASLGTIFDITVVIPLYLSLARFGFWHWVDICALCRERTRFFSTSMSSISQWWLQPKGCVVKRSRWKGGVAPRAPVPASRRRGAVTFELW